MKKYEHGQVVELTKEEIDEINARLARIPSEAPAPTPTIEERVESLENTSNDVILMIAELIGGEK